MIANIQQNESELEQGQGQSGGWGSCSASPSLAPRCRSRSIAALCKCSGARRCWGEELLGLKEMSRCWASSLKRRLLVSWLFLTVGQERAWGAASVGCCRGIAQQGRSPQAQILPGWTPMSRHPCRMEAHEQASCQAAHEPRSFPAEPRQEEAGVDAPRGGGLL